jgi:hypothetical protein
VVLADHLKNRAVAVAIKPFFSPRHRITWLFLTLITNSKDDLPFHQVVASHH